MSESGYIDNDAWKIYPHSSLLFVAPSRGGKTFLCKKLIENLADIFHPPKIEKILYCFSRWQPLYDEMQQAFDNIEFKEGIPDKEYVEAFARDSEGALILDDLMIPLFNNKDLANFFLVDSHHLNLTIIALTQSLYNQGKFSRNIILNVCYFFLLNQTHDSAQYHILFSRMFPGKKESWTKLFDEVFSQPYRYIMVDAHPAQKFKDIRLRANLFKDEEKLVIYKI